jgi:hypothetical protein
MMSKSRRDDLLANLNLSDDETSEYSLGIRKALDRTGAVIEVYGNNDDLEDTDPDSPNPLKAVVILELMLNTADVGANMQVSEMDNDIFVRFFFIFRPFFLLLNH